MWISWTNTKGNFKFSVLTRKVLSEKQKLKVKLVTHLELLTH